VPDTILAVGEGLYELGFDGPLVREGFGGDAANTAVMAARMGVPARIVGRVGDDELGRRLIAFWSSCGVAVDDIVVDPVRYTGIYVNRSGADGAHRFDYHRSGSAGSALTVDDVARVDTRGVAFTHFTGVGLSVSDSSADACEALARNAAGLVSFAANVRPRLAPDHARLRAAAAGANVVFLSTEDAALLYGGVDAALDALTGAELVVTDGARRASVRAGGERFDVDPPEVEVVDSAGAGDALAGAYLAARVRGEQPHVALAQGVKAGALSCRAWGCAASYPAGDEVVAEEEIEA
jgi:2-dehydro-3-deoxygluconokinase